MLWCICSLWLFSLTPFLTFEAVLFPQVEIGENAMCCSSEMACNDSGHILPLNLMLVGTLLVKGSERTAIVNSCLHCIPLWLDKAGSACLITGQASACPTTSAFCALSTSSPPLAAVLVLPKWKEGLIMVCMVQKKKKKGGAKDPSPPSYSVLHSPSSLTLHNRQRKKKK